MDDLFLPHANTDVLDLATMSWREGARLPWLQSGGLGAVVGGEPTVFGGFGVGYKRGVASLRVGGWERWSHSLDSSRVSGLAVSVPEDMFDYC